MFIELLYPLGLLAALGIGIPIALHLWQVNKQRILRVGNINVFARAKRQRVQKLRIKNWLLLVVRCVIVLLLAALLAGPRFTGGAGPSAPGWVLLGAQHRALLTPQQRQLIDSLMDDGYALRAFEPGFRPLPPESGAEEADTVAPVPNQFALIHDLNDQLPAGFPAVIFSKPEIARLVGDIPTTPLTLTWYALRADTADAARFISRAWTTNDDRVAVLAGTSRSQGTHVDRMIIEGDGRAQGVEFRITDGRAEVKFPEQTTWVTVTDTPYSVQIATGPYPLDATYVEAVFTAFAQQADMPVVLGAYDPSVPCDLLFDFSESGVTDTAGRATTLFRYAGGAVAPQSDNRLVRWGSKTNGDRPAIRQLLLAEADTGEVIWADAYGRPVLTRSSGGRGWQYRFYSRFNPQWTDMVWSTDMVNNLLPLLLHPEAPLWPRRFDVPAADRRALPSPLRLERQSAVPSTAYRDKQPTAIPLLTWAVLLTFALERILTHRRRKNQLDG